VSLVVVSREKQRTRAALSAEQHARSEEAKRRQQTRNALDSMTSVMVEDLLAKQSALTEEHKAFLTDALKAYEEFATDTAQDEETRYGVARAYHRIALIRKRLSPSTDAVTALQKAVAEYARLAADFPSSVQYRVNLGSAKNDLAVVLYQTGQLREAEDAYREA